MSEQIKLSLLERSLKNGVLQLSNRSMKKLPKIVFEIYDLEFPDLKAREKTPITKVHLRNNELTTLDPRIAVFKYLKELDLSSNNLTTLPKELGELDTLKKLVADHNNMESLPNELFASLTNLHTVNFAYNKLTTLPPNLTKNESLFDFDASNNSLTTIPLLALPNLARLNLNHNKIQSVAEGTFAELGCVMSIHLERNQLKGLAKNTGLDQCVQLQELYLGSNAVTLFEGDFSKATALKTVNLGYNALKQFPDSILTIQSITMLVLNNNKLPELPPRISELVNLKDLNIANNELRNLPLELGGMKRLKVLDAKNNIIKVIPMAKIQSGDRILIEFLANKLSGRDGAEDKPSDKKKAKYKHNSGKLDLTKQGIDALDLDDIGDADGVTELVLDKNRLGTIPEAVKSLNNLTTLSLASTKLKELPTWMSELTTVTNLDLSSNSLTEVDLSGMTSLRSLNLSFNSKVGVKGLPGSLVELRLTNIGVTELPEEVYSLSSLEFLSISRNEIQELDVDMMVAAFENLKELDISYCNMRRLPNNLGELPLKKLNVEGVPLVQPSRAIVSKGGPAILKFLRGDDE